MKKEEIYLQIKTLLFSFFFGLLIFIPYTFALFFLFMIMTGISTLEMVLMDWRFSIFALVLSIPAIFFVNLITAEYFYKKAKNFNIQKVANHFIIIWIILSIALTVFGILTEGQNIVENIASTVIGIVILYLVFKNVIKNNGKFNYKKII